MIRAVPLSLEGRFAIVTNVGRGMRWTCWVAARLPRRRTISTRTAKSCGPDTPTLVSSSQGDLAGDGGKKARSPGRVRRTPLKPLRREGRMFGQACGDCRQLFLLLAGHGCGRHLAFPAPSCFEGTRMKHNSGASRRENAASCLIRSFRGATSGAGPKSINHVLGFKDLRADTRAGMTMCGSIDTSCALDIRAGAAYEAFSGTTVPASR